MISNITISKILETAQIEEVIQEFLSLKKRGVNMIGLCPFHDEKTPSFTVSPSKGIYKCFGCGAAGNAVKFLMEHEHYSYVEALKYLGEKYNIPIEETYVDSAKEKEDLALKDSLYIINAFAQNYYSDNLFDNEEGRSVGLSYFKERGFREETIKKFQLGYALDHFDSFTKTALDKGYKSDLLQKAGLTSTRGNGADFFKGRVMFTIHNMSGKVVGFGGRTLRTDKKIPKYINTPESDIYHKSKILYGIFFAKTAIRKEDECLLVEGYTDVISLSQAGIQNVVASSGTSLTQDQVRLIKRHTQNITVLFDGDPAGIKAALRGIDIILEQDLNVKIVALPEGEDPDSFVKEHGTAEMRHYLENNSKDFILFKTEILVTESRKDPVKTAEAVKEIVNSIALIPDAIKRALFVKECSKLLNVPEQILITETNKLRRRKLSKASGSSQQDVDLIAPDQAASVPQKAIDSNQGFALQEKDIIRLLLEYGTEEIDKDITVARAILSELGDMKLENPVYNKIIKEYYDGFQSSAIPEQQHFIDHSDPEINQLAIEILHSRYEISDNWDKMHDITITNKRFLYKKDIKSSICRFKLKKLGKMIEELQKEIKENPNEQELTRLQKKMMNFIEKKKQLASDLGTVVII